VGRRWGLLAIAALALAACGEPPTSIVLATLDTVRCDHLGLYGGAPELSPQLDALGARGLVHDAAYTTMPTTGPAHLSIFTGLHPSEHGSLANGEPIGKEHRPLELARRLREQGYATAAFVTSPLLQPRATGLVGFEIYDTPRGLLRAGDDAVRAALAWLDAERRRPVFLWVHLYDAHAPYGGADEKGRSFPIEPGRYGWVDRHLYADPDDRQEVEQRYARGLRAADAALGQLLEGLAGRIEPAPLVVVAGDHGEALGEVLEARGYAYDHGEFLDPEVVCVPLVVAGPGVAPGRSSGAVSLRDIYATLLGAAGLLEPGFREPEWRDLRNASAGRRIVAVERRRIGPRAPASVRAHGAAAFDGASGVIVGAGSAPPAEGADPRTIELFEAALRHYQAAARSVESPSVDPALADALQSLGYAE
jgi:membrane-anchored protein YejM (alkaline phosphatase superfamily)